MPRSLALLSRALLALILIAPVAGAQAHDAPSRPWPPVATFSILGYDPATGEVGGAVQSRVFSVGNGVLWAEAGVGVVATQAIVDVSYGPQALALLRGGMNPKDVVQKVWGDDYDTMKLKRAKAVPLRRGGTVWEVANSAVFFASDESSYVSGVVMAVDGGLTCTAQHATAD